MFIEVHNETGPLLLWAAECYFQVDATGFAGVKYHGEYIVLTEMYEGIKEKLKQRDLYVDDIIAP